jgi:hypothetical protein
MLQPITPNFSRGITTAMSNAAEGFAAPGKVAGDYLLRKEREADKAKEEARYQTAQARQNVLDERATTTWNEQQAEKEKLANAGLLLAAERDTEAARTNTGYNKALNDWTLGGMQSPAPVIQDYPILAQNGNVNIGASVPNVGGTAGRTTYKNVATQVMVPGTQGTAQPIATRSVAPANGISLNTDGFVSADSIMKSNARPAGTGTQYLDTPYGADTKTTKPSMNLQYSPEVKADKILSPNTPKQAAATKDRVTTVMQKVATGMTAGTPPKLNQIEAATIDKIFSTVDPQAQNRQEGKSTLESMLFSLGLNPKQVKEYADIGIESVYGDKNDPVKLAIANAKLGAYEKNIDGTNRLGERIYAENRADARQSTSDAKADARSTKAAKTTEDTLTKSLKTALGKNIVERLDPKNVAALQNSIYDEELKKAQNKAGFFSLSSNTAKDAEEAAAKRVNDMVSQYKKQLAEIQVQ